VFDVSLPAAAGAAPPAPVVPPPGSRTRAGADGGESASGFGDLIEQMADAVPAGESDQASEDQTPPADDELPLDIEALAVVPVQPVAVPAMPAIAAGGACYAPGADVPGDEIPGLRVSTGCSAPPPAASPNQPAATDEAGSDAVDTPVPPAPAATSAKGTAPSGMVAEDAARELDAMGTEDRPLSPAQAAEIVRRAQSSSTPSPARAAEPLVSPGDFARAAVRHAAEHLAAAVAPPAARSASEPGSTAAPAAVPAPPVVSIAMPSVLARAAGADAPRLAARPETTAADTTAGLVQAIRLLWTKGAGEAHIALEPSHLGELTVALRVDQGLVAVRLQSDTALVREWLQSHQQVLRQGLADHQLTLDRLEIAEPSPSEEPRDREDRQPRQPPRDQRRGRKPGEFATFSLEA
jgi:hypothetical protein